MITRKECLTACDGLNNTAGQFRDGYQRVFEYWVLTALRLIIHLLLGNLKADTLAEARAQEGKL